MQMWICRVRISYLRFMLQLCWTVFVSNNGLGAFEFLIKGNISLLQLLWKRTKMQTFGLRRTQSLWGVSGCQERSKVTPEPNRWDRKSVLQLVQQYVLHRWDLKTKSLMFLLFLSWIHVWMKGQMNSEANPCRWWIYFIKCSFINPNSYQGFGNVRSAEPSGPKPQVAKGFPFTFSSSNHEHLKA